MSEFGSIEPSEPMDSQAGYELDGPVREAQPLYDTPDVISEQEYYDSQKGRGEGHWGISDLAEPATNNQDTPPELPAEEPSDAITEVGINGGSDEPVEESPDDSNYTEVTTNDVAETTETPEGSNDKEAEDSGEESSGGSGETDEEQTEGSTEETAPDQPDDETNTDVEQVDDNQSNDEPPEVSDPHTDEGQDDTDPTEPETDGAPEEEAPPEDLTETTIDEIEEDRAEQTDDGTGDMPQPEESDDLSDPGDEGEVTDAEPDEAATSEENDLNDGETEAEGDDEPGKELTPEEIEAAEADADGAAEETNPDEAGQEAPDAPELDITEAMDNDDEAQRDGNEDPDDLGYKDVEEALKEEEVDERAVDFLNRAMDQAEEEESNVDRRQVADELLEGLEIKDPDFRQKVREAMEELPPEMVNQIDKVTRALKAQEAQAAQEMEDRADDANKPSRAGMKDGAHGVNKLWPPAEKEKVLPPMPKTPTAQDFVARGMRVPKDLRHGLIPPETWKDRVKGGVVRMLAGIAIAPLAALTKKYVVDPSVTPLPGHKYAITISDGRFSKSMVVRATSAEDARDIAIIKGHFLRKLHAAWKLG